MKIRQYSTSIILALATLMLVMIATILLMAAAPGTTHTVVVQQSTATPTATPPIYLDYPFYLAVVAPFYSSNTNQILYSIFDHRYPTYGDYPNSDAPEVVNYEGIERISCPPTPALTPVPCFRYDGHPGYDHTVKFAPIRAVADGKVIEAGWDSNLHDTGFGLHIVVEHETLDSKYYSIYGHLSAVYVSKDDKVLKGQVIAFAGNTGTSSGPHLHFEVKHNSTAYTARTDPMGWQAAPGTPDPWEGFSNTASISLWAPDVNIPGAEPIFDEEGLVIVDSDGDSDPNDGFHAECAQSPCDWTQKNQFPVSGDDEFQSDDGYYYSVEPVYVAPVSPDHWARWTPHLEQGGCYEVLVFIPRPSPGTQEVRLANPQYTISYAGGKKTVVLAQNRARGQFISLGAYPFLGGGSSEDEYVYVSNQVFDIDDASPNATLVVDAVAFVPIVENFPISCRPTLYLSTDSDGTVDSLSYANEDILLFDPQTETWAMFFDGSDVGLGGNDSQGQDINLDAFHLEEDGTILLSHSSGVGIPLGSLTAVDDSDVVSFIPTTTGDDTAGDFELVLDGSTVGLSANSEDIDALGRAPTTGEEEEGALLISTIGNYSLPGGVTGQQEDLVAFEDNAWSLYFDGSDVDLGDTSAEDVDGAWVDPHSNYIYLTTVDSFSAGGLTGEGADIFVCNPILLGTTTLCDYWSFLYWVGAQYGFDSQNVDAFSLGKVPVIDPVTCTQPPNCSFEDGFTDWTKWGSDPAIGDWSPSSAQAHSGQFSAHGELYDLTGSTVYLWSEYIDIQPNTKYRASFFVIVEYPDPYELGRASLRWYENGINLSNWHIVEFATDIPSWEQFFANNGDFQCPPPNADQAQFEFALTYGSSLLLPQLLSAPAGLEGHVYIDDVMIEGQPGDCPLSPGP